MFVIEILAKIFKILRSGESPNKIAAGFILGMIIGLTPFWTLHNLILILVIIIINVNLASALFAIAIFSGLAYLFDPLFHTLGYYLLVDVTALNGFWSGLNAIPVAALSRYNNTVVIGSLVLAILLCILIFPAVKYFVVYYRKNLDPKIQKLKIVQAIKGSKFYSIYEKYKGLGE